MTELEHDSFESPFAAAFREAEEKLKQKPQEEVRRYKEVRRPSPIQGGNEAHYQIIEFRRRVSEIEALRTSAGEAGEQWAEGIEGPIINPRIQKNAIRTWRNVFTKLKEESISQEEKSGIIFELMLGMKVSDGAVTEGQMRYLKGVRQKGWFSEIKGLPGIFTPGVMYFIAAFGDLSELQIKERGSLHRFFRDDQTEPHRRAELRVDRVISRWVGTI